MIANFGVNIWIILLSGLHRFEDEDVAEARAVGDQNLLGAVSGWRASQRDSAKRTKEKVYFIFDTFWLWPYRHILYRLNCFPHMPKSLGHVTHFTHYHSQFCSISSFLVWPFFVYNILDRWLVTKHLTAAKESLSNSCLYWSIVIFFLLSRVILAQRNASNRSN